jgi:hypothetical protein
MKLCGYAIAFVSGAALVAGIGAGIGQPEGEEPSMEDMMKMMQEASAPSDRIKTLEPLIGTFDVEAKFWMDPNAEPMTSTGKSDNQWLLDGRFVGQHYTGNFMGMDFEGFGALAFHKETEQYESVWMDNFGTGIMWQTGQPGSDPKSVTVEGEYTSAMGVQKMRNVTKIISNDKHTMEFWEPTGENGEFVKTGVLTYTRAGAGAGSGAGSSSR